MEQTGADDLARVHRHNRAPAILLTQKVMPAFNAKNAKTYPCEGGNEVVTGDPGIPAHAAMLTRWMPMNSSPAPACPRLRDIALSLCEFGA